MDKMEGGREEKEIGMSKAGQHAKEGMTMPVIITSRSALSPV